MINSVNSALQQVVDLTRVDSASSTQQTQAAAPQAGAQPEPAVKVSLQQAAQSAGSQAVQDYRALGQKAVLAAGQSAESNGQNDTQAQQTMRDQAFLATATLKSGGG